MHTSNIKFNFIENILAEFDSDKCHSVLFCKESSAYDEKWEGPRLGFSEAVSFLGVDEAAPLNSLGMICD